MIARNKIEQLRENLIDPLKKVIEETYIECNAITTFEQSAVVESRLQDIRALIEKDRNLIKEDFALENKNMTKQEKEDVQSIFLAEIKKSEDALKEVENKLHKQSANLISNEIEKLEESIKNLSDTKPDQQSIRDIHNNIHNIKSRLSNLQNTESTTTLSASLSQAESKFDNHLTAVKSRVIKEKIEDIQIEIKRIGIEMTKVPKTNMVELNARIQNIHNDLIRLKKIGGNSSEIRAMTADISKIGSELKDYERRFTKVRAEFEKIQKAAEDKGNAADLNLRVQEVFKELNELKSSFGNSSEIRSLTADVAKLGAELNEQQRSQNTQSRKPG